MNQLIYEKLQRLDAQCELCKTGDTMLCEGIRIYQKGEYKEHLIRTYTASCDKLKAKVAEASAEIQLDYSGIPQNFINNNDPEYDARWDSKLVFQEFSEADRISMWKHGLWKIAQWDTFKYTMLMLLFKQYTNWGNILTDFGKRYDLLVLDRFDMGTAPEFILDAVYELIMYRFHNGLGTIITVGNNPRPRNAREKELYQFLESQ